MVRLELSIGEVTRSLSRELGSRLERAAEVLAEAVAEEAPVRTGELRDSVGSHLARGRGVATVTAEAPYAGYVDHGTSRQAPNPFFERGIAKSVSRVERILGGKG